MLELLEDEVLPTWAPGAAVVLDGFKDSRMATPSKEPRLWVEQRVLGHDVSCGPVPVEAEIDAGCLGPHLRLPCLHWDSARTLDEMKAPALSNMHSRRRRIRSASSCCWLTMTSQMPGLLSAMVMEW